MQIRKATLHDADYLATYLLLAMESIIFTFIGAKDARIAKDFLLHFVKLENNQYSWQNCWVAEAENEIVGAANVYDGGKLDVLRAPVLEYLKTHYRYNTKPEDETQAGEYYIDSLGVNPKHQGKGIGTAILQFLIDEYVTKWHSTLGLIVDEDNPNAKKLYVKLGFRSAGRFVFVGKKVERLQIRHHT